MIAAGIIAACAEASAAVYDGPAGARRLGGVFLEQGGSHVLCLRRPEHLLVAWQGTDVAAGELNNNFKCWPMRAPAGGWCHAGYGAYALAAWGAVRGWLDQVDDGRPVYATGHSRGGAAATIAGQLREWTGVVSFGAPKPGNAAFWAALRAPVWRVTIPSDFAPEYPSLLGVPVPGYAQGGQQLELTAFALRPVPYRPLANRGRQDRAAHSPELYRAWSALAARSPAAGG